MSETETAPPLEDIALASAERIIELAFQIPAPNSITPQIVMAALALQRAAKLAKYAP